MSAVAVSTASALEHNAERFATFRLAGGVYAFDVIYVREVITVEDNIQFTPFAPPYVVGEIKLRNDVIPVLDLVNLMGGEGAPKSTVDPQQKIVILHANNRNIGALVDRTGEILHLSNKVTRHLASDPSMIDTIPIRSVITYGGDRDMAHELDPEAILKNVPIMHFQMLGDREAKEYNDTQRMKYVVFHVDGICFGLRLENIREIMTCPEVEPCVTHHRFARGVCNIRGKVIPVVNLRSIMGLATDQRKEKSPKNGNLLILKVDGLSVAFTIDNIVDLCEISINHFKPLPDFKQDEYANYVDGVILGKNESEPNVLMIDDQRMFNSEDIFQLIAGINDVYNKNYVEKASGRDVERKKSLYISANLHELVYVPLKRVFEIDDYNEAFVSAYSGRNEWCVGVINVRQTPAYIFDAKKIYTNEATVGPNKKIILFEKDNMICGFLVESVQEIVNVWMEVSESAQGKMPDFSRSLDGDVADVIHYERKSSGGKAATKEIGLVWNVDRLIERLLKTL